MLLSTVALVAKPKTGKNKDNILKKSIKKQDTNVGLDESAVKCEQCMKEVKYMNSINFLFNSLILHAVVNWRCLL